MDYQNIIGVDTSKAEIVTALHGSKQTKTFANSTKGFLDFYETYADILKSCLVVVEATGGYEREFQSFLHDGDIASHKASGRQVKNFIRSFGQHAKTDAVDAKAIAQYGFERQSRLRLHKEQAGPRKKLSCLVMRRIDLVQMIVAEKNRRASPSSEFLKDSAIRHITFLENELAHIEGQIKECIASDTDLSITLTAIKDTDGIGEKSGSILLAIIPELGMLDGKKIASLCGVAPHPQQSGKYRGYARTSGGRRQVRPMLYLCAMAASRSKGRLGAWYRGLVARGKKPMVALVALMRKIVVIANAKARDARKQFFVEARNHS